VEPNPHPNPHPNPYESPKETDSRPCAQSPYRFIPTIGLGLIGAGLLLYVLVTVVNLFRAVIAEIQPMTRTMLDRVPPIAAMLFCLATCAMLFLFAAYACWRSHWRKAGVRILLALFSATVAFTVVLLAIG